MQTYKLKLTYLLLILLSIVSCSKDDSGKMEEEEELIEPLLLDCSKITEARTLENRGEGTDYIVPCYITIEENADLTIEPGVTLAFEQDAGFEVYGSLKAIGTETDSIIFTGVTKTPGAWNNITIKSNDLNNKMHYCKVEYAGKTDGSEAAIEMYRRDYKLELQNSTLAHNKSYGFWVDTGSNIEGYASNTFTDNGNYPLHIAANRIRHLDGQQSEYTGNKYDEIYVFSNSIYNNGHIEGAEPHVWVNPGVPFFIDEQVYVGYDNFGHLKIREGCQISFGEEYGLYIDNGDNAALEILGSPDNEVVLEGRNGVGSWEGIYLKTNNTKNKISYCTIRDGGQSKWGGGFDNAANLTLGRPGQEINLVLENVALNNSAGCGITIFHYNGNQDDYVNLTEQNVTFNNNVGGNHCQ